MQFCALVTLLTCLKNQKQHCKTVMGKTPVCGDWEAVYMIYYVFMYNY